ncbi:MAG: hypothetical protein Q9M50_05935 [Methylococcales bacterium]|nr:hypothetical protein [Methylococcales bacterium]
MLSTITDSYRRLGLSFGKVSLLLLIFCLNACSVVPKREFSDYQHLFKAVRNVGEEVIINYAVAKKEQAQLKNHEEIQSPRKVSFKSKQLLMSTVAIDDVAIRLKSWKVVDSYNTLLIKLIEGKPIEAESNHLLDNLLRLSVKGLRDTAKKISPFAVALDAIFSELQKSFERRKIIKSIERVSPIISSKLITSMKKDTELFYSVRYGINNYHYQKLRVNISRHIAAFVKLANQIEPKTQNYKVYPLVDKLNLRLEQIAVSSTGRGFKPIRLKSSKGRRRSSLAISQLTLLKTQIIMLLDQAEQQNIALEAYSDMLTAYVRLLGQMDLSLRVMQQAAITGTARDIDLGDDFEMSLMKMRQAFLYYQKTQH